MEEILIYTDGAYHVSKNIGGWAAIILINDQEIKINGAIKHTTNNRMEIISLLESLKYVKTNFNLKNYKLKIISDSTYVVNTANLWLTNWLKLGIKNKKNMDLWQEYLELKGDLNITLQWVKGHNGHIYNELADQLATEAIYKY